MKRGASWWRDQVVADCLGRNDPVDAASLRDHRNIDAFYEELRALATNLHTQISEAATIRQGGGDVDYAWRKRTLHLKRLVDLRLVEVRPLAMENRRQRNNTKRQGRLNILTEAVKLHRNETPMPTQTDLDLYDALDHLWDNGEDD